MPSHPSHRPSAPRRGSARPPLARTRSWRIGVALAVAAASVVGSAGPAGAAPSIEVTQITPVPDRGYYLPNDLLDFEIVCSGIGDSYWIDMEGLNWTSGYNGGDTMGRYIPFDAAEGPTSVELSCDDREGTRITETVVIEVGRSSQVVTTVGTVADECATTTEITVVPGTEVYWCSTLTFATDIPDWWDLARHHVVDTSNGDLGTAVTPLPSGDDIVTSIGLGLLSSTVVTEDVTNTVTWDMTMFDEVDPDDGEASPGDDRPWPTRRGSASVVVDTVAAEVPGGGVGGPGPGGPVPATGSGPAAPGPGPGPVGAAAPAPVAASAPAAARPLPARGSYTG